jgi:hypothetical protein
MANSRTRDAQLASRVKKIADKRGVSKRLVYMVLNGDRENEAILSDFMELQEQEDELWKRLMHKQVNEMVPID